MRRGAVMAALVLGAALWLGALAGPVARAQGLGGGLDDELLAGFEETLATEATWWDPAWSTRQFLTLTAAEPYRGLPMLLTAPDPLLMANTGRCRRDFADLRVVDGEGKVCASGVANPGAGDGTCMLWVRLPMSEPSGFMKGDAQQPVRLYLYYGNPDAKPQDVATPADVAAPLGAKPLVAELGKAEYRDGKAPAGAGAGAPGAAESTDLANAADGGFLSRFVVVEGEDFVDAAGGRGYYDSTAGNPHMYVIPDDVASGAKYLTPDKPWYAHLPEYRLRATAQATVPTAGRWRVLVRYASERFTDIHPRSGVRKVTRHFGPFAVVVGGQRLEIPGDRPFGRLFDVAEFDLDLPAGPLDLAVEMDGIAGFDCIIFTQSRDWMPDMRDLCGPVWMRARIVSPDAPPHCFQMFCYDEPWTSHGPQGRTMGWMLRDTTLATDTDAMQMRDADPATMLQSGEWSTWCQVATSRMPTWWTSLRPVAQERLTGRLAPMSGVEMEFEVATQPDPTRVFRRGRDLLPDTNGLNILMPTSTDLAATLDATMSYSQWADRRVARFAGLGLPPVRSPQRLVLATSYTAHSPRAAEQDLGIIRGLGFNAAKAAAPTADLPAIYDRVGMPGIYEHRFVYGLPLLGLQPEPDPGQTATATVAAKMTAYADALWTESAARYPAADAASALAASPGGPAIPSLDRIRFMRLGDEIGPATNWIYLREIPLFRAYFREYLRAQGLTPAFFGKPDWDAIEAVGYALLGGQGLAEFTAVMASIGKPVDPEIGTPYQATPPPVRPDLPEADTLDWFPNPLDSDPTFFLEEEVGEAEADTPDLAARRRDVTPEEKRLYYWTQRFRAAYTAMAYGAHARAIRRIFPSDPLTSPNFQAMPIMRAYQWDGGLDLFEFGRDPDGLSTLLMEDWIQEPYRVAFGMELLKGAGRPSGTPPSGLIVGGGLSQRLLTSIGQGAASNYVYLYGPRRVSGPPFADHEPTLRDLHRIATWTANREPALLATTPRPAEAAILLSTAFEINRAYFTYPFRERHDLYAILQDSGIPVEIIDAPAVDAGALARYKVLYVHDPHVPRATQAAIAEWVAAGGTLWCGYGGLARDEYDQPSDLLNVALGLVARGPIAEHPEQPNLPPDPADPATPTFQTTAAPLAPGLTLATGGVHASWTPAPTAQVLATYPDGSPAALLHTFGKGRALLLGAFLHSAVGTFERAVAEPPDATARRRLVTAAADLAGVQRPVQLPHGRVLSFLRDGAAASVLTLVNCYIEAQPACPVAVQLPRPPVALLDGDDHAIPFTWDAAASTVHFQVDLPLKDGVILEFRY